MDRVLSLIHRLFSSWGIVCDVERYIVGGTFDLRKFQCAG
jgi:hypothetical protein